MSLLEASAGLQDQVLGAIKVGQEQVISAVSTITDNVAPLTDKLPAAPFADRLPNPATFVDNYFGFAEKLLASQKDFASKLADAYRPAKTASQPAPKAAKKTA